MATVQWNPEGLDSLIRHDAWRLSHGWEPIATERIAAVEAYFRDKDPEKPPRFLPGRPVALRGKPADLRMVFVEVRSKRFRVYFRYHQDHRAFEILQVLHPRAR